MRLSKSLVIKGGGGVTPSESKDLIFAAETLHLPVPRVHRTFTADIPDSRTPHGTLFKNRFIVMDYVQGPTLDRCWESLDMSQRQSVVTQVVAMIEKMQATTLKLPPGLLGGWEARSLVLGLQTGAPGPLQHYKIWETGLTTKLTFACGLNNSLGAHHGSNFEGWFSHIKILRRET